MNSDDLQAMLAIGGLALITVLTRAFFMIPRREIPMPGWLRRGLKYAPLAALTAVIAPEVFMTQGVLLTTWQDARLPAVRRLSGWRHSHSTRSTARSWNTTATLSRLRASKGRRSIDWIRKTGGRRSMT